VYTIEAAQHLAQKLLLYKWLSSREGYTTATIAKDIFIASKSQRESLRIDAISARFGTTLLG
jgi:hypothetical protein